MRLSDLERAMACMHIFKKYHPDPFVHILLNAKHLIALQEVEFGTMSQPDREYLIRAGWTSTGPYEWTKRLHS